MAATIQIELPDHAMKAFRVQLRATPHSATYAELCRWLKDTRNCLTILATNEKDMREKARHRGIYEIYDWRTM